MRWQAVQMQSDYTASNIYNLSLRAVIFTNGNNGTIDERFCPHLGIALKERSQTLST